MKFVWAILLGLGLSVGSVSPAAATSITYEYETVAGDPGPGAGIVYTLEVDTVTKKAIFTIDGSSLAGEVWRADWFTFKWASSANYELTNLVAPSGDWRIADATTNSTVKVLNGGTYDTLLEANRSGFYLNAVTAAGGGDPTATGGICLAPGSGFYSCSVALPKQFTFNIDVPTGYSEEEIPFKVGYYDGLTGNKKVVKFITGKLSRELDELEVVHVPDGGSTLALLGLSTLGLGLLRRFLA